MRQTDSVQLVVSSRGQSLISSRVVPASQSAALVHSVSQAQFRNTSNAQGHQTLSPSALAGVIIGVGILVIVLVLGIWQCIKWRQLRKAHKVEIDWSLDNSSGSEHDNALLTADKMNSTIEAKCDSSIDSASSKDAEQDNTGRLLEHQQSLDPPLAGMASNRAGLGVCETANWASYHPSPPFPSDSNVSAQASVARGQMPVRQQSVSSGTPSLSVYEPSSMAWSSSSSSTGTSVESQKRILVLHQASPRAPSEHSASWSHWAAEKPASPGRLSTPASSPHLDHAQQALSDGQLMSLPMRQVSHRLCRAQSGIAREGMDRRWSDSGVDLSRIPTCMTRQSTFPCPEFEAFSDVIEFELGHLMTSVRQTSLTNSIHESLYNRTPLAKCLDAILPLRVPQASIDSGVGLTASVLPLQLEGRLRKPAVPAVLCAGLGTDLHGVPSLRLIGGGASATGLPSSASSAMSLSSSSSGPSMAFVGRSQSNWSDGSSVVTAGWDTAPEAMTEDERRTSRLLKARRVHGLV